jgi:enoyl-CoA hydratase
MADLVRYEVKNGVAVLTIDNPPVNALAPEVWGQIDEAVKRGVADPAADAIVLIGAGTTFIAGADIKAFELLKTPADSMARSAGTHALLKRMEDASKPLVAAIHGNALGGGLEVAQACHFRVATKDARVGQPEVMLGLIPGAGGTQRLARVASVGAAKELILTGRRVRAPRARELGIVSEVVPAAELAIAAAKLADDIAAAGPLAVAAAKRAIDGGASLPLEDGLALEAACYEEVLASDDRNEGLNAFAEKRAPVFKGR